MWTPNADGAAALDGKLERSGGCWILIRHQEGRGTSAKVLSDRAMGVTYEQP